MRLRPVDALAVLDVLMPGRELRDPEWDVVSGPVPSSGEFYEVLTGSHLRLVDDLRVMVAALPVCVFSVVACPGAPALRVVRDELAAASGVGMVNVFPTGWTDRAKAATHVTLSDGMDGLAQFLDCL